LLVSSSYYQNQPAGVIVWDLLTGQSLGALPTGKHESVFVFFRGAERSLVTAATVLTGPSGQGEPAIAIEVIAWDAPARRQRWRRTVTLPARWACNWCPVDVSPDGRRLAVGGKKGTIKIWDLETGNELLELRGHSNEVLQVVFSPDGRSLASGSGSSFLGRPGELKLWDVGNGREVFSSPRKRHGVMSVSFSPDGRRLATGSGDRGGRGELSLWDAATGQELISLSGMTGAVTRLAFSPDGRRLATNGWMRSGARIWDTATGTELFKLLLLPFSASFIFNADGRYLIANGPGRLEIWDAVTGPESQSLRVCESDVGQVAWSPDGRYLATAGTDTPRETLVWDARIRELVRTIPAQANLTFCADGRLVTVGRSDVYDDASVRFGM
jgi:WD40 repeat protein